MLWVAGASSYRRLCCLLACYALNVFNVGGVAGGQDLHQFAHFFLFEFTFLAPLPQLAIAPASHYSRLVLFVLSWFLYRTTLVITPLALWWTTFLSSPMELDHISNFYCTLQSIARAIRLVGTTSEDVPEA